MACPEVVLLKKHILVMSFIGRDQVPAPTLKEAKLSRDQLNSAYQQCTQVRSGGCIQVRSGWVCSASV